MERPKTYIATIKVTFDAYGEENPRSIAENMADYHNGMRGANLYVYSVLKKLAEETTSKGTKF